MEALTQALSDKMQVLLVKSPPALFLHLQQLIRCPNTHIQRSSTFHSRLAIIKIQPWLSCFSVSSAIKTPACQKTPVLLRLLSLAGNLHCFSLCKHHQSYLS